MTIKSLSHSYNFTCLLFVLNNIHKLFVHLFSQTNKSIVEQRVQTGKMEPICQQFIVRRSDMYSLRKGVYSKCAFRFFICVFFFLVNQLGVLFS